MVTLWLDADGVPCDGSPYVAGTFNDWNATDIEMTYDDYSDQYFGDIFLSPGSYEYKFVCYNWAVRRLFLRSATMVTETSSVIVCMLFQRMSMNLSQQI